jgi:hypothetical protein
LRETFGLKGGDKMKRIIALCLIVCLSLSLSPFSSVATAEEGEVAGFEPQRRIQPDLAEQIAQEFWNYRCGNARGEPFIAQTEANRAVFGRILRSPPCPD